MLCPKGCGTKMEYFYEMQQGACRYCGPGSAKAQMEGVQQAQQALQQAANNAANAMPVRRTAPVPQSPNVPPTHGAPVINGIPCAGCALLTLGYQAGEDNHDPNCPNRKSTNPASGDNPPAPETSGHSPDSNERG